MAGTRRRPRRGRSATRTPSATPRPTSLSRRQASALLGVFALVVAGVAAASTLIKPSKARAFELFHGSLFLDDDRAPVAVNLADGKATVRLVDANAQVDASSESGVAAVPLDTSTLLLNEATGEFNIVDSTGFVIKTTAGGVPLPKTAQVSTASGYAAGSSAYIVQAGKSSTAVYLVGQTTVEQASSVKAKVTPRAFATIDRGSTSTVGSVVSANNDLWLLTDTGSGRTVAQLTLPANSKSGVELTERDRASAKGLAVLGSASQNPDGTGAQVVALATAGQLQLFEPNGSSRTLAVSGLSHVDQILPSTNAQGTLSFLYHSSSGWSLVSAAASGSSLQGPKDLGKLGGDAKLIEPAVSNGSLYTMDTHAAGLIWTIGAGGTVTALSGQADYPTQKSQSGKAQEAGDFSDAYVVARSDRVVFNSPNHVLALTAFSDDSHTPVTIDKSAAVDLNAAGGAAAIKGLQTKAPTPDQPKTTTPVTPPVQNIDNTVNCATSNQIPHIPTITEVTPAARSVQLTWTYPLLDPQDCVPSTYQVSVKLLSTDAPQPPALFTVQGQQGVNITGLFPETQYLFTVAAYINGHGTVSGPVDATTGREGPPAPTGVQTTSDGNGNWTITWHSCGSGVNNCVPTSSWNIIPRFCDGTGVSSPPATITEAGDPTLTDFSAVLHADSSDLGRGLSFSVQGVGKLGDVGTSASDSGCAYSWQTPIASAFTLSAGAPPAAQYGSNTSSTTVTLAVAGDPIQATGGVGGQYTYQLLNGSNVVATQGPTSATTATFGGIASGQTNYSVRATVSPPRHPETSVPIQPVPVQVATTNWPDISVAATFADTDAFNGTLTTRISGITSAGAGGESFRLVNSQLVCGNTRQPLSQSGFDPATPLTFAVSRLQYSGGCSVSLQLQESGGATAIFGGQPHPAGSASVSIDPPSFTDAAGDFSAAFSPQVDGGFSDITVSKVANPGDFLDSNWSYTVDDGDGKNDCLLIGNGSAPTTNLKISQDCVEAKGTTPQDWRVTVSYTFLGQTKTFTVAVAASPTPPTYVAPVTPPSTPTPTPTKTK